MEGLSDQLTALEDVLQSWSTNPGVTGPQLRSISSEISSSLDEISPEDVPSVVKHLVGDTNSSDQRSLLRLAKSVSKEKEAGDFLRDVCEIFTCLVELHPQLFTHKLLELFSFCKTLFFVNPAAKTRVESLKLLEIIFDCHPGEEVIAKYDLGMLTNQSRWCIRL